MALHVPPPTQHASIQPTTTTTTVAPPSPPQLPEEVDSSGNPVDVAEEYVRLAIQYHEQDDLEKATSYFRRAAERGNHIGMLMMGLSLRHGWGCAPNASLAFQYLQKAAESAVFDLHAFDVIGAPAAKNELAMAIFELGISFRHGWGVAQNKATAAYYFEIAANLGDADAQLELAFAYEHGDGVRKDLCKAAKYYRLAHKQGHQVFGTSWIWKPKFDS